jgi:hypothetical protein
MIQDYLIGELSVQLERLQAATRIPADDVAALRHQVETMPVTSLSTQTVSALMLADRLCWDSLSRGDIAAFSRQASICADLRLLGVCARLIDED